MLEVAFVIYVVFSSVIVLLAERVARRSQRTAEKCLAGWDRANDLVDRYDNRLEASVTRANEAMMVLARIADEECGCDYNGCHCCAQRLISTAQDALEEIR